jgi:hypothetical protein
VEFKEKYPGAGFEKTIQQLETERMKVANTIGRK